MDIKRIGENVFIYAIGIVALRAAAFFLIPLYTHFLSVEEFGILSTILVTIQLMQYIMPLGMWESVCKYYEIDKKTNQVSYLFGTSVALNLFGGILTSLLALTLFLPLMNKYIHHKDSGKYILLACFISLTQSLCQLMMAFFRAENKAIKFMLTGTISSIILLILTSVFIILQKKGILGALYAQAVAYMAVFFVVFTKLIKKYKFNFSFNIFKRLVSFGHPLVISSLSMFIIQSSGVYFLGYFGSLEDTAIFSLGYKFSAILYILITAPFQLAFAPYFYSHGHSPEMKTYLSRILIYMITIPMLLASSVLFLFRLLFPLIAPLTYFPSYTVCLFLIPGVFFLSIKIIGETILNNFNKTSYVGLISLVCAAMNLLLSYFLIPHFRIYGAVASSSITMILWSITMLWFGRREYPFYINIKKALWIMTLLIVSIVSYFFIRNSSLIIFVGIGVLLFAGIILLLARSKLIFDMTDRIQIKKAVLQIGRAWKSKSCPI